MLGHPAHPACDHRPVTEGNRVGSAPTNRPRGGPFVYNTRSEPTWAKILGGVVIAGIAVVALVAVGVTWFVWTALGGVSHTATDKTVSAARAAAKPTAGADVERLVTVLRPVLGQPVRRALVDGCMLNNPDNYVSNDIACRRSYYLYYPTAEPPLAAVISGVLADDAHTTAYDSPTQSGWATTSGVGYRSGEVWIVSKPATASTYITVGPESPAETVVDEEGCSELDHDASTGANVVVKYTISYFYG